MNGGAGSSEYLAARGGRHRRGGAGTWTPGVTRKTPTARHASTHGPLDPPLRGLLPITPPRPDPDPGYPPARGELPAPPRTKVTLVPVDPPEPEHALDAETADTFYTDDVIDAVDAGVHPLPPDSGLGNFNLGSVPASVTPPRSWRRAAWFAAASSGGVVVALLFAGSALVSKPTPEPAALGWMPGLGGGGHPALNRGQQVPTTGQGTVDAKTSLDRRAEVPVASNSVTQSAGEPHHPTHAASSDSNSLPSPSTVGSEGRPVDPPSPSPSQASYDADPLQLGLPKGAPAVLAASSQKFFETVVKDPEAAHRMTTGRLRHAGAASLASKYADIAYFEVEHIQVHQYDGKTVCTMRAVHKDGSRTTERHVLTFAHGKIEDVD